jgi:hypothetical protein
MQDAESADNNTIDVSNFIFIYVFSWRILQEMTLIPLKLKNLAPRPKKIKILQKSLIKNKLER